MRPRMFEKDGNSDCFVRINRMAGMSAGCDRSEARGVDARHTAAPPTYLFERRLKATPVDAPGFTKQCENAKRNTDTEYFKIYAFSVLGSN